MSSVSRLFFFIRRKSLIYLLFTHSIRAHVARFTGAMMSVGDVCITIDRETSLTTGAA